MPITYSEQNKIALTSFSGEISFHDSFLHELTKQFHRVASNQDIEAFVIRGGSNTYFNTGADMRTLYSLLDNPNGMHDYATKIIEMFDAYKRIDKPIFIISSQTAIGGGTGFFTGNKNVISILGAGAKFQYPNPEIGIVPSAIIPGIIDKIGKENAVITLSNALAFDRDSAQELGLVQHIKIDDGNSGDLRTDPVVYVRSLLDNAIHPPFPAQKKKTLIGNVNNETLAVIEQISATPEEHLNSLLAKIITESCLSDKGREYITEKYEEITRQRAPFKP